MLAVSMPNLATSSALVETATKCLRTPLQFLHLPAASIAGGMSVGQRFRGRECFGTDNEQGFFGIKTPCSLHEIRAINIGDETKV